MHIHLANKVNIVVDSSMIKDYYTYQFSDDEFEILNYLIMDFCLLEIHSNIISL
jgi:hypothetical protein